MYARNTRPFANSSEQTQDKLNPDKTADMVSAGSAQRQQLTVVRYIYT